MKSVAPGFVGHILRKILTGVMLALLLNMGTNSVSTADRDASQPCIGMEIQPREAAVINNADSITLETHVTLAEFPDQTPNFQVSLFVDQSPIGVQQINGQVEASSIHVLFVPDIDPDLLVRPYDGDRDPGYYLIRAFDELLNVFNFSTGEPDQADILLPGVLTQQTRLTADPNELKNRWNQALPYLALRNPQASPKPSELPKLWVQKQISADQRNPVIVVFLRLRRMRLDASNISSEYPNDWIGYGGLPVRVKVINLIGNPRGNDTNDVSWGNVETWTVPVASDWMSERDNEALVQGNLRPLKIYLDSLKTEIAGLRNRYVVRANWSVLLDQKFLQEKKNTTIPDNTYVTLTYQRSGSVAECSAPLKFFVAKQFNGYELIGWIVLIALFVSTAFLYISSLILPRIQLIVGELRQRSK